MNTKAKPTTHSRHHKPRLIAYSALRNDYVFRRLDRKQGLRCYAKVCEAYSLDIRSGKDAIFLPHELVEPLYPYSPTVVN